MAVSASTTVYGTADVLRNTAVQDVDVSRAGIAGQTTAQAQLVALPAGGGATASFVTTGVPFVTPAPANASGTITAGGTQQTLMAANAARRGWAMQNQSTDYLYVRDSANATADQNSLRVAPGQEYVSDYITGNILSIIGPTTGQAFWAREW